MHSTTSKNTRSLVARLDAEANLCDVCYINLGRQRGGDYISLAIRLALRLSMRVTTWDKGVKSRHMLILDLLRREYTTSSPMIPCIDTGSI